MIVISDTTPLISLLKIKRLDLLEKIFGQVFIPYGVFNELTQNKSYAQEADMIISADFIVTKSVSDKKAVDNLEKITSLDRGESEAIILFSELKADLMLMDERRGREVALKLKIPLSGTLGVLLEAFDKGISIMNKTYGYCRISTPKQNIERQIRNILKENPEAIIVQETFTGSRFQGRKELEKLLRSVQTGDTIIFDSVSRMSRNAEDGFALYEQLYNHGVNLVFLKEPHINTDTYSKILQEKKISLNLNS